jgi:hypothetical protein
MATKITDKNDLDKLIQGLTEINERAIIVGVMEDEDKKIQVIASSNEFGAVIKSPKALAYMRILAKRFGVKLTGPKRDVIIIPERSYIRSAFDDSEVQNKITETMSFYLKRALTGKNTFEEILTRAGNYLQRMIQARMKGTPPKNHPLTIAMKGGDQTLINKGNLIDSIKTKMVKK